MQMKQPGRTHVHTHTHHTAHVRDDMEELRENRYSYGAQGRKEAGKDMRVSVCCVCVSIHMFVDPSFSLFLSISLSQ